MNGVEIRLSPAAISDRENLLHLHKTARYETDMETVPEYAQATMESGYYEKLWNDNFPSTSGESQVIKAAISDHLVGFCRFGVLDYEYPNEKLGNLKNGLGELHQLYVEKFYRGKYGVGEKLYRAAKEGLKQAGYRHMLISMIEGNAVARSFYEKAGAFHAYSYPDNVRRGDKVVRKMVAVYIHENI